MMEADKQEAAPIVPWLAETIRVCNDLLLKVRNELRDVGERPAALGLNSMSRIELLLQAQQVLLQARDMVRSIGIYTNLTLCEPYVQAACILRTLGAGLYAAATAATTDDAHIITLLHAATHAIAAVPNSLPVPDPMGHPTADPTDVAQVQVAVDMDNARKSEEESSPVAAETTAPQQEMTVEQKREQLVRELEEMVRANSTPGDKDLN